MSRLIGKRGDFYAYQWPDGDIEVSLGPRDEPESENVTVICKSLLPDLIAVLRLAQDKQQ